MRTIDWIDGAIEIIDQTALPDKLSMLRLESHIELISAIQRLAVRGAPALGVAGAMGVALIAADSRYTSDEELIRSAAKSLLEARPTAVNLSWGVERALREIPHGPEAVLRTALEIRDAELANSLAMGARGSDFIQDLIQGPVNVMTICNTGGLAAVEYGTALSVVRSLFDDGALGTVLTLETRPLLQGARLTAWELKQLDIPFHLIVDSAGPFLLSRGAANIVLIGADRIAANGDTANKIGSYSLASAAARLAIPFIVVAPESTVDMSTATGEEIEIEDRGSSEITSFSDRRTTPEGVETMNPAFDVTPVELITALITESRVVRFDMGESLGVN
ncbi:S-methyl-5-thioribose-1-phosphate isomerase [Glaciihabitans sp. UYNi722]|uniref:S-methyl-5-thioribose-1-phosphate isomerase n=1 Tax=Glaciihabitans sp. UYNi722 TaxID=3156344 RepID=UPI003395165D